MAQSGGSVLYFPTKEEALPELRRQLGPRSALWPVKATRSAPARSMEKGTEPAVWEQSTRSRAPAAWATSAQAATSTRLPVRLDPWVTATSRVPGTHSRSRSARSRRPRLSARQNERRTPSARSNR